MKNSFFYLHYIKNAAGLKIPIRLQVLNFFKYFSLPNNSLEDDSSALLSV